MFNPNQNYLLILTCVKCLLPMQFKCIANEIKYFRFRNKYNPSESLAYQNKLNQAVRKRASVFIDLFQSGWFNRFTLTAEQGEEITKLLDAGMVQTMSVLASIVVDLLEGGIWGCMPM